MLRRVSFWYVCPASVKVSEYTILTGLWWLWAGPGIGDNDRSPKSSRKNIVSPAELGNSLMKRDYWARKAPPHAGQGLLSEPWEETKSGLSTAPQVPL